MDTSLSYSPSPRKPPPAPSSAAKRQLATASQQQQTLMMMNIEEGDHEDEASSNTPKPTILFESQTTKDNVDGSKRVSFSAAAEQKENAPNIGMSATMKSFRDAELDRLRATNKSPMRRNLAKMTEVAIGNATSSVNKTLAVAAAKQQQQQSHNKSTIKKSNNSKKKNPTSSTTVSVNNSLNAIRKAKTEIVQVKSKAVKSVRFQWEQENTQAKTLQQKVEENRRQIRAIQRQLSSAHFKEKAQTEEAKKLERFAKLEEEYMFNSEVFRDHQQQLKQERDESRRMSIDARSKIRRNKREGEERLKMIKLEEEQAIFDVRSDLHKARMEAAKANAESRRKSFQFRAGDARRIRGIRAVWREKELREMHKSYELDRAAAKDVDNYKKQVAKEEREDIFSRNLEARELRKLEENQANAAMIAEHKSYELKWAGERDAEAYRKRMQAERRKSLAGRNKESVRHAKVIEELQSLAREKEAESFMLKWAGEEDVKAYLAKVAEGRRQSLQFRGMEARKVRQLEQEEHAKAVHEALIEDALQSDCKYQKNLGCIINVYVFFRVTTSKLQYLTSFLSRYVFQLIQAKKMSKST